MNFTHDAVQSSLKVRMVQAVSLVRPMIGGSRPFMAEANDGSLYIVKTCGNRLHPNLLANEVLGSALCVAAGLPVPAWRPIELRESFLREFDVSARYDGYTHHPAPGLHYASRMIESVVAKNFTVECLPGNLVKFVQNRRDFLGMYILDICAGHRDNRQAIFVKEKGSPASSAFFIDHGHMFGGSNWDTKSPLRGSCHINIALYGGLLLARDVKSWLKAFRTKLPYAVDLAVKGLPSEWYTGDLTSLQMWLHHRIETLPGLIDQGLERTLIFRDRSDASMHVQGSRVCAVRT